MKNNSLKIIYVFIVTFCSSILFSQQFKFKNLTSDEGLLSVNVKTVFQDKEDFIWFGTQDGLYKYDGYHFTTYKSDYNNEKSLTSSDINCITEDAEGKIYVGTNASGLSIFNKINNTFLNYNKENSNISDNTIKCLFNLNTTELLIGTNDGLCLFNKKTKRAIKIAAPINANETQFVIAIFKDSFGTIWVSLPKFGLFQFNENTKQLTQIAFSNDILKTGDAYKKRAIMAITQVDNVLYCGTFIGGLIKYDLQKKQFLATSYFNKQDGDENKIRAIVASADKKQLQIATLGGLVIYDIQTTKYEIVTKNPLDFSSIASNQLLCLMLDKQQNLWVGTEDNGASVNFSNSKVFTHYNKNQLKGSEAVYSFLETKADAIFIGTEDGLYTFNKKNNQFTNISNSVSALFTTAVWSLVEDDFGNIWVGTYNEGIIVYNPKTNSTKKILPDNYCKDYILKLVKDKNNTIWAGTYNYGLLKINQTNYQFTQLSTDDGLHSNIINDVFIDVDNSLWLSTTGGGIDVVRFENNKPKITQLANLTSKNSVSSNLIYSIIKDNQNTFWIATNNGLNSYKDGKFTVYTEKDGLPNTCIYNILQDDSKSLWLTTNNGVSNFNPKNKIKTGNSFINYNTINGIQAKEFNQGAAYKCADGKLLIGGMKGFNYFEPKQLEINVFNPKIYIYSYSRQGNQIATDTSIYLKKHLNLKHTENYFGFEVVALDFSAPEKLKYKYKLEGNDADWSAPVTNRNITYTGLEGGTYNLLIKATNSDGVWIENPYKFTIKITPPWYKTIGAIIGFALTAFALIFGFITYRTNAIKKENKVLENKVEERTHELAQKNRDITSSIQYAKRIQEAILPAQQLIFSKLKNSFLLYKPKDIVSGDFYWFGEKNNYKIIAIVDCTGHGVPGAFMSMIGHNLLNQIVNEKDNYEPGIILNELHKGVQAALKQGQNQIQTNDGMDLSILAINTDTNECLWSGAFRNLIIISHKGELIKLDGNKFPIGGAQLDNEREFVTHKRQLTKNDTLFMYSDGYADQFGGDKSKKFMVKRFNESLINIINLSSEQQKEFLNAQFETWKGNNEQVDDVLVFGLKV